YQAEAARQQARASEHQAVNNARTGFLTVKADSARLLARQRAEASAQRAYDATSAGYSVGTRNIVDLLLSETNLYAARRDYANARYDYVINTLRLQAAVGMLDENAIRQVNGWLTATKP
ncbi:TolC family protein, partial [Acinetobacter baumannii]